MTAMFIVKSGDAVYRAGTFGRQGRFVQDPTLWKATPMQQALARALVDQNQRDWQELWDQYPDQHARETLAQWQAAVVVAVKIVECG